MKSGIIHKKVPKSLLSLVLTLAMCITLVPADAFAKVTQSGDYTYGDWTYVVLTDDLSDDEDETVSKSIAIVRYTGEDSQVVVPSSIEHEGEVLPVTQTIKKYSPMFPDTVEKITFQEGMISIGDGTCENKNNLKEVVLADSIEYIGNSAFNCCQLSEVVIPENVKTIRKLSILWTDGQE